MQAIHFILYTAITILSTCSDVHGIILLPKPEFNHEIEIEKQKIIELPLIVQITPKLSEKPQLLVIELRLPDQANVPYRSHYLSYSWLPPSTAHQVPVTTIAQTPQPQYPIDLVQPFRGSVDIAAPAPHVLSGTTSSSLIPNPSNLPSNNQVAPLPVDAFSNAIQSNAIQDGFGTFAAIAAPGTTGFQQAFEAPFVDAPNRTQPQAMNLNKQSMSNANIPGSNQIFTVPVPDPDSLDNRIQPNVLKSTVG